MMPTSYKWMLIGLLTIILGGCSVPEFYLDIHYPPTVNLNEPLPIDVFITNSRTGTIVHIESILLSGELAQNSQLIPGRSGLYSQSLDGKGIIAEPNRRLTQFESGTFSLTLRPINPGVFVGNFTFYVNGQQISREISVEVK